ncbi:Ig-like domain-containing protein [Fictibacillus iocasae]|uniref:Ig-like domain-containing protein n=1 Tax=Fictibacillus iocasae TaxID=2715437 RepID=A0ABW2NWS8_9BACL
MMFKLNKIVITLTALTFLLISIFQVENVQAANGVLTFVSGSLTEQEQEKEFFFTVPSAGRVSIDITSYVKSTTHFKLYDSNNVKVFGDYFTSSSSTPGKHNDWVDLEAGTYRLKVGEYNEYLKHTGDFTLQVSFSQAGNNEAEPNNGTVEAQPLFYNKSVTGFLSWNDSVDVYKLTVDKAGRVHVNLSSFVDSTTTIKMTDEENEKVFSDYFNGSSLSPAKYNNYVDLEPGNYYISIYNNSEYTLNTGKYQLTTSINYAGNNDTEPNNGTVEAQSITFYQPITGFLSWNDSSDFYKVSVQRTMEVKVDLTSYVDSTTSIVVYDEENNKVTSDYFSGDSQNPAKYIESITLKPGNYYIKVFNNSEYTLNSGKYKLTVTAPSLLPNLTVSPVTNLTTKVVGKTAPYTEVVLKLAGKDYKTASNHKGDFSANIPKQNAGAKVEISAKNLYGTKNVTITVVDKIAPAAPAVNGVKATSKTISGRSEAGSTVYAQVGSKIIGAGKADAKGKFSLKIKNQKKGTTIVLFAKDSVGNKGKTITIKVK